MDAPITINKVIDDLGGSAAVAALLKITTQAVWNMKDRETIPPRHWAKIVETAKAKSLPITFEILAELNGPLPPKVRASA